jgi:hypothetical protein
MFRTKLKALVILGSVFIAGFLLVSGCKPSHAPVPAVNPTVAVPRSPIPATVPPPVQVVIPFTEGNETFNLKQIVEQPNIQMVKGNFNPDEFKDLATVQEMPGKEIEISVYLGRKTLEFYSKAGSVRRTLSGKLVGFMTSRPGQFLDLVILVAHSNAPNEVIHFRNDGTRFEEIQTVVADKSP